MARRKKVSKKRRQGPAKGTYIKKLGLEMVPERTPQVLRKRISTLNAGLKAGKYKGALEKRARKYLRKYRRKLENAA